MVRKNFIPFLSFLLICSLNSVYTQTVRQEQAIKVAEEFYLLKADQHHIATGKPLVNDVIIKKNSSYILYYIINFEEGGFLLISADERFFPVLAYSFQGRFNPDDVPENCRTWLDIYETQINHALSNGGPFYPGMPAVWDKLDHHAIFTESSGILPLTVGQWAQDGYYNQMCPADQAGYNGHVPVGCVALAMAQLMYYYRFPASGNGTMQYTPGYQGGIYGIQYVDFAASTYDWNVMTDKCRETNDAIARICYHAGVAIQTAYGPQSSGGNIANVPAALENHFFYITDDYLLRSDVTGTEEWVTLLINNLDNRQPVLYRSSSGWGGHVYVCDGYQDSTHFHFNWGWGGAYNGFFYIDNLAPGGIDINSSQGAIFNIYPDTTQFQYPPVGPDFMLLTNHLGSFEDGSGPDDYSTGVKRTWLIKPEDPGITNILLEFLMVDTESGTDMVKVYDGDSEESPLVASLSGNDFPVSFNSSGPELFVTFETGYNGHGNGFHASYYGYHLPFCYGNQMFTDPAGVLGDGSRYHNYVDGSDCEWLISPFLSNLDSIEKVRLYFNRFALAAGDTVFIYDGPEKTSPLLGKFSMNDTPGSMVTNGNRVLVNFITDEQYTAQGWELGWEFVQPVFCQDTLYYYTPEAVLSDGSGDKNYIPNTDCYYVIDVQESQFIKIDFMEVDLETGYDYLKFIDPENPYAYLYKISGHELPDDIIFPYNKLLVQFHSDERDNYSGWKFSYSISSSAIDEFDENISLFPNPVYDKMKVEIGTAVSAKACCMVYGIDGVMVMTERVMASPQIIDLKWLPGGMYFIVIENGDEKSYHKILKY